MYELTHIDLFTGLGGFSLAAAANEVRTVVQCEVDPHRRAFLESTWRVPVIADVNVFLNLCKEYVHIAGSERFLKVTQDVSRAIRSRSGNGDPKIEAGTFKTREITLNGKNRKSLTTMEESALVAESQQSNFFAWITSEIMVKKNVVDTTSRKCGESHLSEDCQKIIKSYVSTATTQKQSTEYVLIKRPYLLTAGVPCQPASRAGEQRGSKDSRWFWPQTIELCKYLNPRWALFENPPGIDDVGLGGIIAELEGLGYEVGICSIPACAVNSPQDRERYWIIAGPVELTNKNGSETRISGSDSRQEGNASQHYNATEIGTVADTCSPERRAHAKREGCIEQGHNRQRQATGGSAKCPAGDAVADSQRKGLAISQGQPRDDGKELKTAQRNAWSSFDWLRCPDGKGGTVIRRIPTGFHELANGLPARIPKKFWCKIIAALGDSIVWPIAAEIIGAMRKSDGL